MDTNRAARWVGAAAFCLSVAACEIGPVAVGDGDDHLVVEAVLRTGEPVQRVLLHRTVRRAEPRHEPGASVSVHAGDRTIAFAEADPRECLTEEPRTGLPASSRLSCYLSPAAEGDWVVPGGRYELQVRTRRGEYAHGHTTVPGAFRVRTLERSDGETSPACVLAPERLYQLEWTTSSGAAGYVTEMRLEGLAAALRDERLPVVPDTFTLVNIAMTETTAELPRGFLAARQTSDAETPLVRRLQNGLPAGVRASVTITALDRNFANAARMRQSSPAGPLRPSSIAGDGVGVFGSITPIPLEFEVAAGGAACLRER
jgi:hypothetical protein